MSEEKEPKEKKKLITIEGINDSYHGGNAVYFALVSSPENGRKQATSFMTCRDFLNDSIRSYVNEGNTGGCSMYHYSRNAPIDTKKMRLLIYTSRSGQKAKVDKVDEVTRSKVFSCKATINIYEDLAGWERSKITTVNHTKVGKQAWLLTGSGNWMLASNLLSMVTLIMRIAVNRGPLNTEGLESLKKNFEKIADRTSNWSDSYYLYQCYNKFEIIMKHWKEIFSENIKDNYPDGAYKHSFHGCGGIVSLCTFATNIGEIDKKFKKICEEYNKNK